MNASLAPRTQASPRPTILTEPDLLPGDILLYRPLKPNFIQRRIINATESPYTHVAIYVGGGFIAESVAWPCLIGIRKVQFERSLKRTEYVGVLRSQLGFGGNRPTELIKFVDSFLQRKRFYNLIAAARFKKESREFFNNQLEFIRRNYGKTISAEKFSERSFFCSAFVVACYSVVGAISDTAQAAYPPEFFSPAGLYRDPTFGWLLGFLSPNGNLIRADDPLLFEATHWQPNIGIKWWP